MRNAVTPSIPTTHSIFIGGRTLPGISMLLPTVSSEKGRVGIRDDECIYLRILLLTGIWTASRFWQSRVLLKHSQRGALDENTFAFLSST